MLCPIITSHVVLPTATSEALRVSDMPQALGCLECREEAGQYKRLPESCQQCDVCPALPLHNLKVRVRCWSLGVCDPGLCSGCCVPCCAIRWRARGVHVRGSRAPVRKPSSKAVARLVTMRQRLAMSFPRSAASWPAPCSPLSSRAARSSRASAVCAMAHALRALAAGTLVSISPIKLRN